jgi:hypothetical protein
MSRLHSPAVEVASALAGLARNRPAALERFGRELAAPHLNEETGCEHVDGMICADCRVRRDVAILLLELAR